MMVIRVSISIVIIVIFVVVVTIIMMVIVMVVVVRVSVSVVVIFIVVVTIVKSTVAAVADLIIIVIFLFFITEYGMTESSNSMNCVMSNSNYSSDGVVDKSEDEVFVIVIYFKSIFYKFVHNFFCHIINFFITEYGMTESSNSVNCVMSNSSYSSDSVVDKSEDEVVFSFATFSCKNVLYHLLSQNLSEIFLFFITKYGMTKSSNSMNCMMSNSSYSSNSVVNKSKDEISVFFVVFHICLFKKFICQFFSQFVAFFISKYGMTKSSNSSNCVMSNSGYSSDSVVNKSEQKVFVFF